MSKIKVLMLGESLDRQGGIVSVEKLILRQSVAEIEISHLATLPNGSTVYKMFVFIQALGLLLWRILTQDIDIVHIHISERGSVFRHAITTLITWFLRKPVILHTHSAEFHAFYANLPQVVKISLSWIFCKSTLFIVLSHSWKKFYMKNLGLKEEQIIILPNPVKFPTKITHRDNPQKVNLLFLGRIGDRKGAFDLIEAFSMMPVELKKNVVLTIAGDGESQRARDLIEKLNLSEYICILDWVNEQQRDELLCEASIFILPSYNEGLPMALLEAMSWGLAPITTSVGGIPELITSGENGLLIEPGNIPNLSMAMQSLILDPQLKQRLGKNARESVRPLDIKNYFVNLYHAYRSVLI